MEGRPAFDSLLLSLLLKCLWVDSPQRREKGRSESLLTSLFSPSPSWWIMVELSSVLAR